MRTGPRNPPLSNKMHGGGRGTTARYMQLNRHILDCGSTGELCELIETHAEEFNAVNVATAFRKLLQSRRDGVPRGVMQRALNALEAAALRSMDAFQGRNVANILHIMAKTRYRPWDAALVPRLEGRAEALAGTFNAQEVASTLWAYATMGREPGAGVMRGLEGRAEALAGTFKAQDVANTLWAYARMGRGPGAGLMRGLEGRVEAVAGTFTAQNVANTLWAACVFSFLFDPGQAWRWVHTLEQRLVSLGEAACFNTAELCQVHQVFVSCSVEPGLRMEAVNDMWALKETCLEAFVCAKAASSGTQQQVSETLRHMGMSVEDEVRCPKSGYSIDMMVHDSGRGREGERSSSTGTWVVEFDGPSHFLTSRAPTGATQLERRHSELLGHALVTVPHWEWEGCKRAGEREQYLRDKLADCVQTPGNAVSET